MDTIYVGPLQYDGIWLYADHPDPNSLGELNGEHVGKWCITRDASEIDDAWQRVQALVRAGQVVHAKASGRCQAMHFGGTHLICVYTKNWQDDADVMRVRELLRQAGFVEELGYKRDADTRAGVYGGAAKWYYRA